MDRVRQVLDLLGVFCSSDFGNHSFVVLLAALVHDKERHNEVLGEEGFSAIATKKALTTPRVFSEIPRRTAKNKIYQL